MDTTEPPSLQTLYVVRCSKCGKQSAPTASLMALVKSSKWTILTQPTQYICPECSKVKA